MELSFKARYLAEWNRLNPRSVSASDIPVRAFLHAMQDGAVGYFAPLRLLAWFVLRSWRR